MVEEYRKVCAGARGGVKDGHTADNNAPWQNIRFCHGALLREDMPCDSGRQAA